MIVVGDTAPLNYLIQIICDRLLFQLYKRILVPKGAMQELGHAAAPASVHAWMSSVPNWVDVLEVTVGPDAGLADLDLGEHQAIQLAEQQRADLLLIDERKGRQRAKRRGLTTTGTLGVL
jgi:predicted nucleic acid-binding protein